MARQSAPRRRAVPAEAIAWTAVAGETLSARITAQIRGALFSGQIKAGDRLGSEGELAGRFGVSRMAVRDALRSLAATGIVDVRVGAKGGIFIAQGNADHFADALAVQLKLIGLTVEEVFDAQIAIEVTSAELAARRATESDLKTLHELLRELQALAQPGLRRADEPKFAAASMRFHEALVAAAHSRALSAQFKALRFVLEPVYLERTTDEVAHRVVGSHKALLTCIENRDADSARGLMQRRLEVIRARHLTGLVKKRAG
ncbi:MAG: FadR family transcriptional regulator [Alphaproteobacteria bacterium]|nr:FadR family transcriptional regulator [Alphaproteobacteria bacterium]